MSVLTELLAEIIGRLDPDDQPGLLALLGSLDADQVGQFALDESVTSHESALDDGADGITFTTVRQSRPSSVFLAWDGVQGVSGHGYYELQFSTSASEAGVVYTAQQQATWHITDALAFGTTYHVRGRAVDAAGHVGDWGSWQTLESLQTVTDDLGDGTVTTVKIGNAQITTAKIATAAITNAKIGSLAVDTAEIQNGAITTAKIGNAQITNAKIDSMSASKITAGTISASSVAVATTLTLSGTGSFRTGSGQDRIVLANSYVTEQRFYRSNVIEGRLRMAGPSGDDFEVNANRVLRLVSGENLSIIADGNVTMSLDNGCGFSIFDRDSGNNVFLTRLFTSNAGGLKLLSDRAAAGHAVQVRNGNDSGDADIRMADYHLTSDRSLKRDVAIWDEDALALLQRMQAYSYAFPDGIRRLGFMADEMPDEIVAGEVGDQTVSGYGLMTLIGSAVRVLARDVADLHERFETT